MSKRTNDPMRLFTLHARISGGTAIVTCWETRKNSDHGRTGYELEVLWRPSATKRGTRSKVIFPRGQLWGSFSSFAVVDGPMAKEHVLSNVAMKPGDTDSECFEGYTPEQLDWCRAHGEELSMIAEERYGNHERF